MHRKHRTGLLLLLGLGLAACSDSIAPGGTEVPEEVRQDIVSILDESGFFADDFGAEGATDGAASGAAAAVSVASDAAAEEVTAPRAWGRRRGLPVRRQITIEVNEEEGTAVAWKEVEFDGRFLLDITDDGQLNPTSKPLQETLFQHAEFERLDQEVVDEHGHRHRWRLVAISPAAFEMTDEANRTVNITQVTVEVNDEILADITDPAAPIEVQRGVPKLRRGDEVTVTAYVSNDNQANTPPTFVFLHLFHASPNARIWLRLPMLEVDDEPGAYARSWTVRQTGRERIAVDAIDSETFTTESEDDYRANIWGVPYVVLDEPGA
jgi:hypothetical protein